MPDNTIDPTLAEQLAAGSAAQKVDALFAYMEKRGQSHYDEVVTQLQHALQCARHARLAGGDAVGQTAALLHDIGHFLLDEASEDGDFTTQDFVHEEVGAVYLEPFFIAAVTWPVKMHVPAKRYICTVDATYYDTLSAASKRSLALQGGLMSASEKAAFAASPYCQSAVQLRTWDDLAKEPGLETPGLESYRVVVQQCLKPAAG